MHQKCKLCAFPVLREEEKGNLFCHYWLTPKEQTEQSNREQPILASFCCFSKKKNSSIYSHRWMLGRELGLRNQMELSSYKLGFLSKLFQWYLFLVLISRSSGCSTGCLLVWMLLLRLFSRCFSERRHSWEIKSASQRTKGMASKLTSCNGLALLSWHLYLGILSKIWIALRRQRPSSPFSL